ncbi:MAG: hypothetical protein BV458_12055 [Thermoplasmata archaeon M9B2D]|nr:MAG: hypothetical protein BV458_12055 [Thermoplasmata archaeon M9B2D]
MKLVTAGEMKRIDLETINDFGVPSLVLMERAGEKVAMNIEKIFKGSTVTIVSGPGNNGGDGLVAARLLLTKGYDVKVFLVAGGESALSPDCHTQFTAAKNAGVDISMGRKINPDSLKNTVVVDSVFGTGLNKPLAGEFLEVITAVNKAGSPVLAVDIPSGISADTGNLLGGAVKADYTVTFGLPKIGHCLYPGAEYTGKLFVEDIGFPDELTSSNDLKNNLVDASLIRPCVRKRKTVSHKGSYGHVFVLAGSPGKTGAALLSAKACMRAGAGAVTIGIPDSVFSVVQSKVLEEMTLPLPSSGYGTFSNVATARALDFINKHADAVVIGPGIGLNGQVSDFVKEIILFSSKPLLADADALNCIAGDVDVFRNGKGEFIVTPHPGEMKRLLIESDPVISVNDINRKRMDIARLFAVENGVVCLLKGVPTVISSPDGDVYLNTTGNPGMATAGSGDVLSGIIASFMGQGHDPLHAAVCGAYIHGLAGDLAARDIGEHSLIAGDIIQYLPDTLKRFSDNK